MTWTKQPPKESGYYWYRAEQEGHRLKMIEIDAEGICWQSGSDLPLEGPCGEWWDQRITEPHDGK